MIVEINVRPISSQHVSNKYAFIESALEVIKDSGLKYEVGALGTTVEDDEDKLWDLIRRVHEVPIEAGAEQNLSTVKIYSDSSGKVSMSKLTEPHRD